MQSNEKSPYGYPPQVPYGYPPPQVIVAPALRTWCILPCLGRRADPSPSLRCCSLATRRRVTHLPRVTLHPRATHRRCVAVCAACFACCSCKALTLLSLCAPHRSPGTLPSLGTRRRPTARPPPHLMVLPRPTRPRAMLLTQVKLCRQRYVCLSPSPCVRVHSAPTLTVPYPAGALCAAGGYPTGVGMVAGAAAGYMMGHGAGHKMKKHKGYKVRRLPWLARSCVHHIGCSPCSSCILSRVLCSTRAGAMVATSSSAASECDAAQVLRLSPHAAPNLLGLPACLSGVEGTTAAHAAAAVCPFLSKCPATSVPTFWPS